MQVSSHQLKVDITIDKSSSLPCIQHENQNTVPRKHQNFKVTHFFKATEVQYFTLYAKMKFQTNVVFKSKNDNKNIWKFYALIDVYYVCVMC